MKQRKITELEIDDFTHVIPIKEIENVLSKREMNHFNKFMRGQTMQLLDQQTGIYRGDLEDFLRFRKQGLSGKNMPLTD